ncbi:hypothetical protein JOM56_007119 [Amanita muscaria]
MKAFFTFSLLLTLQGITMAYASPAPQVDVRSCYTTNEPFLSSPVYRIAHTNMASNVVLVAYIRTTARSSAEIWRCCLTSMTKGPMGIWFR